MPNPRTILAYTDIKGVLDRALEAGDAGCNVIFGSALDPKSKVDAKHFIGLVNSFRKLDRVDSHRFYPEGHSMHGQSRYDLIRVRLDQCKHPDPRMKDSLMTCVHFRRRRLGDYEVIDAATGAIIPSSNSEAIAEAIADEIAVERRARTEKTNKDFLLDE
jgi:hypothetical protein